MVINEGSLLVRMKQITLAVSAQSPIKDSSPHVEVLLEPLRALSRVFRNCLGLPDKPTSKGAFEEKEREVAICGRSDEVKERLVRKEK